MHMSTILTEKSGNFGFAMDFLQQYFKNLLVNLLSVASVNRINALITMRTFYLRLIGYQILINNVIR